MALPWVLFENILEDGTLTATSEESGFPAENLLDWRPWTAARWKATDTTSPQNIDVDLGAGNTASPDTLAIGGHNLFDQTLGRHRVFYSDDGISYTGLYSPPAGVVVTDGLPFYQTWTSSAHRYWRVRLSGTFTTAIQAGVVTLGRRIDFETWFGAGLDPFNAEGRRSFLTNDLGAPLGADVAGREWQFNLDISGTGQTASGFYAPASGLTWDGDWRAHALTAGKPFWFAWDTDEQDDGLWLCRASQDATPLMHNTDRRTLSVPVTGWREVA